jgi:hypothetical protein
MDIRPRHPLSIARCVLVLAIAVTGQTTAMSADIPLPARTLVESVCFDCHQGPDAQGGLDLEGLLSRPLDDETARWERIVRRVAAGQMPPPEEARPDKALVRAALDQLTRSLDEEASRNPRPGRTETFRRLTRFEYRNAIRDLLRLDVDVTTLLPADEISQGFDNITVGELSPALLSRYLSAAQKVSRLAIGRSTANAPGRAPDSATYRVRPDVTQEERVEGLPLGTRGGLLVPHNFPQDGFYEFTIRLARDRNEEVEGLSEPHRLDVLVDSRRVGRFTIRPPGRQPVADPASGTESYSTISHADVDRHLTARVHVPAGPHQVGVTFLKNPSSLLETKRQPLPVHFNMYRHPRLGPAVYQLSITGPFESSGIDGSAPSADADTDGRVAGLVETPSRRAIFTRLPSGPDDDEVCAREILTSLTRRAYRRPVTDADLIRPLELFREGSRDGGFETGIEVALSYLLISPEFLFRVQREPAGLTSSGTPYQLSDIELASRLSFFLWGSLPDDELLELAEAGRLSDPAVLGAQADRMLKDRRSWALTENFAGQWLYLRNLDSVTPDARLFPDFDDNLRQAFRKETELFFDRIIREDRSVLELLRADETFLNERLAKHYGIPHVYGSHFRRVKLDPQDRRGGLLRQGSLLSVTSYATRTSPVLRGKWVLENILGTPPPPPPPDIPALSDAKVAADLPVRERLAQHRADPTCAACHRAIDPIGFALENYDAVGRWRELESGGPIDVTGALPDGRPVTGIEGLETGLLEHPELFVSTLSEKLLTYAIGRGHDPNDAPAIRLVVSEARDADYRFSAIIRAIVTSVPFRMRTSQ